MLITPVQPHNSLNNIALTKQQRSSTNQSQHASSLDTPLRKVLSTARKNLRPKSTKVNSPTLARKKIMLEMKLQETMRKNAHEKLQSIEEHKEDLIQRKQMLSDILKEYEQISKDKNILTAEIKNMKKYLSDIRSKLDQSLMVLNKNTTLFAMTKGLTNQLIVKNKSSTMKQKRLKKPKKIVKRTSKDPSVQNALSVLRYK